MVGTHNAVPGIDGIGPVKAMKIVQDEELLEKMYDEHGKVLRMYERLIRLPFSNQVNKSPKLVKAKYDERGMIKFMSTLGIDLTKPMRQAFMKLTE